MLRRFKIILEKDVKNGGFAVTVPALPGCATQGESLEEAIGNAKEAIELFLEGLRGDGLPVPEGDVLLEEVEVSA